MGATIPGRGEASAQARRLKCTGGFQSWAGGGQGEREGGREEGREKNLVSLIDFLFC